MLKEVYFTVHSLKCFSLIAVRFRSSEEIFVSLRWHGLMIVKEMKSSKKANHPELKWHAHLVHAPRKAFSFPFLEFRRRESYLAVDKKSGTN